jgi:hypothetical protein
MDYLTHLFCDNFCNVEGLLAMCVRFIFNFIVVWGIVHYLYYPKGRRRDYYFTFILLSASIFMLIYLMDGSNLQIGAALGLFAVFGIIRYRTESVPIREMTYLFFLVAVSVLNGTKGDMSLVERVAANLLLIITVWAIEARVLVYREGCKFVRYDNIDLITTDRREELIADLERRLGVKVLRVEVGAVDFLTDMAMLRVFYEDPDKLLKPVDRIFKIPRDNV